MLFRRKRNITPSASLEHEPMPGSFHSETPDTVDAGVGSVALREALTRLNSTKPEIFGDDEDSFVVTLRAIKDRFKLSGTVVYPGSSTHAGVARVFGRENVTHVDPETKGNQVMIDAGYKAIPSMIEDFRPNEPADVIVALNSYGTPSKEVLEAILKPGGRIVTNNWTHWAAEVSAIDGTELIAAFLPAFNSLEGQLLDAAMIPENATEIDTIYMKIEPDGMVVSATA